MKQKWGREDDAGDFPSDRAVWTVGAFCVALLSVFAQMLESSDKLRTKSEE
jgi:hypothetical protein